jgi:hypothetical protein
MAELKTKRTKESVDDFIDRAVDEPRRQDCRMLTEWLEAAVGAPPRMWGASIVGFGDHHYKYSSGREGDSFVAGFAARKADLTLYLPGDLETHAALLSALGKHRTGKSCLYIKRLSDVDGAVLRRLIAATVTPLKQP